MDPPRACLVVEALAWWWFSGGVAHGAYALVSEYDATAENAAMHDGSTTRGLDVVGEIVIDKPHVLVNRPRTHVERMV